MEVAKQDAAGGGWGEGDGGVGLEISHKQDVTWRRAVRF